MRAPVRFILGVAGLALFGLWMPAGAAAAADAVAIRIEMFGLAGLHVLTLHTRLEETGDHYAITTDYATTGAAGLVVSEATRAQVRGRFGTAAAQPEWYRKDTRRNGVEHHSRVDYHPDGTAEGSSTPPLPDPVPPPSARGTVDNLTAYFLLERQLANTGKCALAVPVFDGRHRYDLYFTDVGQEVLAPAAGQRFKGNAIACRMRREFRAPVPAAEQEEGAEQGTIWYAQLIPGDVMVPVRMRLETQLGTVDGYLAAIAGRGVDRKLME